MDFIKYWITILAMISVACGVKVSMQGSLSFGKDVLDTLTHYMRRNMPSRRSMPFSRETDVLYLITKSTYLCRELVFCEGKLELFLNEYITLLTKSIEAVFDSILNQEPRQGQDNEGTQHLFETELKKLLREVRKLLRAANLRVTEENEAYIWIDVIKKISSMFQEAAIVFSADKFEVKSSDNAEAQKKLMQKFVIATIVVEGKYESKLCTDYNVCSNSYECSKALDILLGAFEDLKIEKVQAFIRYVAEALLDTTFYSHVSEVTANELQVILNDMGYSDNVPTKEVMNSIHKAVKERLSAMKSNTHFIGGKDVELVHIILSDVDHFYAKRKPNPFHGFLSGFFEWVRLDTKFRSSVYDVMKDIGDQLLNVPDQLQVKLIHEVRAFLELTVDPEK